MSPPVSPCIFYDGSRYDVRDSVGHHVFHVMMLFKREVELAWPSMA